MDQSEFVGDDFGYAPDDTILRIIDKRISCEGIRLPTITLRPPISSSCLLKSGGHLVVNLAGGRGHHSRPRRDRDVSRGGTPPREEDPSVASEPLGPACLRGLVARALRGISNRAYIWPLYSHPTRGPHLCFPLSSLFRPTRSTLPTLHRLPPPPPSPVAVARDPLAPLIAGHPPWPDLPLWGTAGQLRAPPATGQARPGRIGLAARHHRHWPRGEREPVGLEDAIHVASLVSGTAPPLDSVMRFLAVRLAPELREMATALESAGDDTLKLLKEHIPGLAVVVEQVGHLLDVSVAVEATEKAKDKKQVAAAESNDDCRAKIGKVECGGFKDNVSVSAAGL
nr:unnamed protein product [Digitaria exilis]